MAKELIPVPSTLSGTLPKEMDACWRRSMCCGKYSLRAGRSWMHCCYPCWIGRLGINMKEKSACKRFATKNGISLKRIKGSEIQAIYWLERTSQLYLHSAGGEAERLIYDFSWGFSHRMLERINQHIEGSFIQYFLGFPTSGEIISRTVIEFSINFIYIMQSNNRLEKIFEYLSSYIDQERKQNSQWNKVIDQISVDDQAIHLAALSQKSRYLDQSEEMLLSLCHTELSMPYPSPKSWGNVRDRFIAVGEEMAYRTTI